VGIHYNPTVVLDGLELSLDFGNKKNYSYNVHPYPTDITKWMTVNSGTTSNGTISADYTMISPVGGVPIKVVQSGNDNHIGSYNLPKWNLASAKVGETWTASVYVKASTATTVEGPVIFGSNAAGTYLTAAGFGSFSVDTNWKRISYSTTMTNPNTEFIQVRLDGTQTGGSGVTIWWDGLQLEKGSSATEFNSIPNVNGNIATDTITTSNFTFHGDGYWSHANGGLTFERTTNNLIEYSEDFANARWANGNISITSNTTTTTAPDGTNTASQIVPTTAGTVNRNLSQAISSVSAGTYTLSVYAKMLNKVGVYNGIALRMRNSSSTSDAVANYNLSAGTASTGIMSGSDITLLNTSIQSVGNGWYRCSLRFQVNSTLTSPRAEIWYGGYSGSDNFADIFIWGSQLENSLTTTTYNKTTALPASKYGGGCRLTTTGNLAVSNFLYNNHTWEIWFKINDRTVGNYGNTSIEGVSNLAVYRGYHAGFWYSPTALTYQFWDGITSSPVCASWTVGTSGAHINEGSWAQVVVTRSGNVFTPYVNGVQLGAGSTNSPSNTGIGTTNELWLGKTAAVAANTGQYLFYSRNTVGNMKMYTRALSAFEVLQNFNALRGRYGL